MKNVLQIEIDSKKVILILEAVLRENVSYDELTVWAAKIMELRDRDALIQYDKNIENVILAIEMSEDHNPFTPAMARDFIHNLKSGISI